MRSHTPADLDGHCPACLLRFAACVCAHIPRVETRCRFVVLRHAKEVWRTSNTARLAALALPRCELLTYGGAGTPIDFDACIPPDAWLLFPEGGAEEQPPPDATLVVLDGSWAQARRMAHRVKVLQSLRRLAFPGGPQVQRLRRPTVPNGMSTLEAIATAVGHLEDPAAGLALHRLHETLVQRGLTLRRGGAS